MGYSQDQKRHARIVLGIRTEDYDIVSRHDMDRETLMDLLDLRAKIHRDQLTAHEGAMKALMKRLKDTRKAKRLANARADRAERVMRKMLDEFKREEDQTNDQ